MKKIFALLLVAIFLFSGIASARPTAKITVKAINEQGEVIEGAKVTVGFVIPNSTGIGTSEIHKKGQTNNKGEFSASSGSMHLLGFSVDKDGYYQSGDGYEFISRSLLLNRWEPWNPTVEVVLKKKRNPVAMYRKYLEAEPIPVLEAPAGYDLEKGDWVAPYGIGIISDLIFICQNKYQDFNNAETSCDIAFSNPNDGLQQFKFNNDDQSYFKWPFEAPDSGYDIKKLNKWMSVHMPDKFYDSNYQENTNYLFRVRSKVDKDGNIIKANYGKIAGDIRVYKKAEVNFTYYFNPDGTRNLEEDPEKNLFRKK